MKKKIAQGIILTMASLLLGFTAYETMALISMILPDGLWWLGIGALMAFDLGALGWAFALKHGSVNDWMKIVAGLILAIDILGCGFSWISSMAIQASGENIRQLRGGWLVTAAIILGLVIFLNVALGILHWLLDTPTPAPASVAPTQPVYQPGYYVRVENPAPASVAPTPENPVIGSQKEVSVGHQLPALDRSKLTDFFTFSGSKLKLKTKRIK